VGFTRVTPKATGRPGYAPGDLLYQLSESVTRRGIPKAVQI
jgi:hypothetical protein